MIRTIPFGAGSRWIDVCGDVLVYDVGHLLVAVRVHPRELEQLWATDCGEPIMFVRCAIDPVTGEVAAVAKGNSSGAALFIRAGGAEVLGVTNGNNPIAIAGTVNGWIIRWTEAGGLLASVVAGVHSVEPIPEPYTGTSQGLIDLSADGDPLYMDARRTMENVNGWTFTKPNQRNGWIVGQTDPTAIRLAAGDRVFTVIPGAGDDPHLSVLPDGRVLVGAYTPGGALLAIVDPPYPEGESPAAATVERFDHPFWAGYFWRTSDRHGDNPDAPGNCEFVDEPAALERARGPVIVDAALVTAASRRWESVVALWVASSGNVSELESKAALAVNQMRGLNLPRRPVLGYLDHGRKWERLPVGVDWFGQQLYCEPSESLQAFEARAHERLSWFPSNARLVLVAQAYDRNGAETDEAKMLALQALWPKPIDSRRTSVLWFSDGRAGGTRAHEAWRPWHRALVAAIPSTPAIETIQEPGTQNPEPTTPAQPPSHPQEPHVSFPKTPDDFRITEFPQLIEARRTFLKDPAWEPDAGWCIHQMGQRYGLAGISSQTPVPAPIRPKPLSEMIAHELDPEGH